MKIIREQSISFNERGLAGVENDLYIKLDSALAKWLRDFQGARLSTFLFIALSEAHVCADNTPPPTLKAIVQGTGYSPRAVLYAVQWLEQNNFVMQGEPSKRGAKTYRPKAFAWFGSYAKTAHYANCIPTQSVVVDGSPPQESENISSEEEEQQQQTRRILHGAGIIGAPVDRLSSVKPDIAQAWADWITAVPEGIRNPQGIAVSVLSTDPNAVPPQKKTTTPKREPRMSGGFIEKHRKGKRDD